MSKLMLGAAEFFAMPIEDRMQFYSEDPSQTTRMSTSFNVHKEEVFNWRDCLRHHCYQDYVHTWPSKPSVYREVASGCCSPVRSLLLNLKEAISETLGIEADFLNKAIGSHGKHMAKNYYPKCQNLQLTCGLPPHSDPNVLTVLLKDDVPGLQELQVFKNGQWIAVNPIPNSFVLDIGDQLQVLINSILLPQFFLLLLLLLLLLIRYRSLLLDLLLLLLNLLLLLLNFLVFLFLSLLGRLLRLFLLFRCRSRALYHALLVLVLFTLLAQFSLGFALTLVALSLVALTLGLGLGLRLALAVAVALRLALAVALSLALGLALALALGLVGALAVAVALASAPAPGLALGLALGLVGIRRPRPRPRLRRD